MLDMTMAQMVHAKRFEEELEARNTLIAERGIQAAIEYENALEERREMRRAWPWFIAWVAITVIGCCII